MNPCSLLKWVINFILPGLWTKDKIWTSFVKLLLLELGLIILIDFLIFFNWVFLIPFMDKGNIVLNNFVKF
jgi:hypothetical protein